MVGVWGMWEDVVVGTRHVGVEWWFLGQCVVLRRVLGRFETCRYGLATLVRVELEAYSYAALTVESN